MTDVVIPTRDVRFEYPGCRVRLGQGLDGGGNGIGPPATFTEPIRVAVGQGLCHRCQCQLIKRLHGSVVKRRNRKRPVLAVLLRDVNPSQRFGLRATLAQALRRPPCGSGALPQDTVNAGSLAPVVRGHAFDRQELGVERAGEPVWPGANLVPPTRLDRLCDTYLYPSDFPAGQGPVDPVPWRRIIVGCTSRSRLLLAHLGRLSPFSRNGTPVGRGHAWLHSNPWLHDSTLWGQHLMC
jgi:hypothetical protein